MLKKETDYADLGVDHVINYDAPRAGMDEMVRRRDEYVHRIGRTGRVGNPGRATTLFDFQEDAEFAPELVEVLAEVRFWCGLGNVRL